MAPGMYAGFKAGTGDAHQLLNPTDEMVVYLEVGDRTAGDAASYPDDDLQAAVIEGRWVFAHKDGRPVATILLPTNHRLPHEPQPGDPSPPTSNARWISIAAWASGRSSTRPTTARASNAPPAIRPSRCTA